MKDSTNIGVARDIVHYTINKISLDRLNNVGISIPVVTYPDHGEDKQELPILKWDDECCAHVTTEEARQADEEHAAMLRKFDAWAKAAENMALDADGDDLFYAVDNINRSLEDAIKAGAVLVFEEPPAADEPATGAPAFPAHCLNVGGQFGQICDWMNETAPVRQPVLSLGAALVTLGAVFGRRYQVPPLNTMTNLLGIGLVRTGGGKDHARKQLKKLLYAAGCDNLLMGDEVTSGAAIRKALERHPALVGYYDEFGRELQDLKSWNASGAQKSTLTTIMKLYGDAGSISLGKEYAASAGMERKDIHFPSLGIWGTTTGEAFYGALQSGDAVSGFLNRWIVFEGERQARMRTLDFDGGAADDAPPHSLVDWLQRAAAFAPDDAGNMAGVHMAGTAPKHFTRVRVLDDEARAILRAVAAEQDDRLVEGGGPTRDLWARYFENTVKVAGIRAIADNFEAPELTAEHAAWARDLVRWSVENLAFAMQTQVADSTAEREVNTILNFMREAGGWVSKRDFGRGIRSLNGKRRGEILSDLVEQGEVEIGKDESTRPVTVRYRICA